MPHVLFGPEVREMLQENDTAGMKAFCESLHPATVAEALAGAFDVESVWRFLKRPTSQTRRPYSSISPSSGRCAWWKAPAASGWQR